MLKILNGQSKTITSAAFVLAIAAVASRFLGFARNAFLAGYFGAGDTVDAYYAAFRIPDLVFNILVLGALSAGFIPIFTKYLHKNSDEAWKLANDIINILTVFLIAIAVILFFVAPIIVPLIVPGFSGDKLDLTIQLSRIMFLQPIFLGLSAIFGGILQSFKRFLAYSLAPIFYNLGIISGILFFVPLIGLSGLAWGVVLGAFLHWVVQVPAGITSGFRYKFIFNFKAPGLKKILALMVPRTLSLLVLQINLLVITIIASTLRDGSIAVFNFANDLQYLPIGVFAVSFAVAAFPTLSSLHAKENEEKFISVLARTLRKILFFLIPISILVVVLRAQIVRVTLGYGNFGWEDTIFTIRTLSFFAIGIAAHGLAPILVRAFFALHNTIIPLIAGIVTVVVNVIFAFILSKFMGVSGLALAFSIASFIEAGFLLAALKVKLGHIGGKVILNGIVKFLGASLLAALVSWLSLRLADLFVDTHTIFGILSQGILAGIIGVAVYFFFTFLFGCKEVYMLKKMVLNKFYGKN